MSRTSSQFLRYLVAGGVNTLATYALLVALMRVLPYLAAYTSAYVLGIALGYALQSRFVFGVPIAWRTALRFPLAYIAQYAFGALLLWLMVSRMDVAPDLAAIVVVVASIPVGFLLNRRALRAR
ncbi:MAG TPA: GtrA family protein [Casimicrobiaceae bacterium]|nr:GtrA family protein [Casimicrobiaceae bacterium]